MQQLLDTAYERSTTAAKDRFAELVGGAGSAAAGTTPHREEEATPAAEARLRADVNIAAALEWLDEHAGWSPGEGRRRVAARLASVDVHKLRDRAVHRGRVTQREIQRALSAYYGSGHADYGTYSARCGSSGVATTTILTRTSWLDLACPLRGPSDRIRLGAASQDVSVPFDRESADAAVQRLAETLELGTRLVDMPLYRLQQIGIDGSTITGTVGVAPFVQYALTMDLLEGETLDAVAAGGTIDALSLRDRYLPDLDAVTGIDRRFCAGGVLALCAIARPSGHYREADYLVLVQQRSGNVLNANLQLAVIPKGFHQSIADYREDSQVGTTLLREMEEELFGREDVDNTTGTQLIADPMHHSRMSEPMKWLMAAPLGERLRTECTGFGLNLVSGNFEFASLIVIEDVAFWNLYGGMIEANWESMSLRRYSTQDPELLTELLDHQSWSNEGLFAVMQGLRRLSQVGGDRVNLPPVEWEVR